MIYKGYCCPNYFIKFGKKEHLEQLAKGQVFMRPYSYYRSLELGQGDENEGLYKSYQTITLAKTVSDLQKGDSVSFPCYMSQESSFHRHIPIFCATFIGEEFIEEIEEKDGHASFIFKIPTERFKKEFGADSGLMVNYNEFLEQFRAYCKIQNNLYNEQGLVTYWDFEDKTNPWLEHRRSDFDSLFWEDESLRYQNEIRFLIGKDLANENETLTFNIGEIKSALFEIEEFTYISIPCIKERDMKKAN